MREIKFRAWDKKNNKWHTSWAALFPWGTRNGKEEYIEIGIMPEYFDFQQFTGLKDRHGKEIYEGDILDELLYDKFSGEQKERYTVEYGVMKNCFDCTEDAGIGFNFHRHIAEDSEIIGNIYENPDLLTKQDEEVEEIPQFNGTREELNNLKV